jgi:hypothetical protein
MKALEMRNTRSLDQQVFSAKAVNKGGIVRRAVPWVEREIGRDRFLQEVEQPGFHLLECAGQFIVICSDAPVRRWL